MRIFVSNVDTYQGKFICENILESITSAEIVGTVNGGNQENSGRLQLINRVMITIRSSL